MPKEINVQELKQKLDADHSFLFVDVREPDEYEAYNLGATLIPLGTIPERLDEFGDKSSEIIVHCKSGGRSQRAQQYLEAQGFKNVINVSGGATAYRKAYGQR